MQRYIFRQVLVTFLIVQGAIIGMSWIIGSMNHLRWVINNGMPFADYMYFNFLLIPINFKGLVTPSAVIAVIFVYNRLNSEREAVAMSAAGLSHLRLAMPGLVFAMLLAAFMAVHLAYISPMSYREFRAISHKLDNAGLVLNLKEKEFTSVAPDLAIYVGTRHSNSEFERVLVWETKDADEPLAVTAEQAKLIFDHEKPFFAMFNGTQQVYDRESRSISFTDFEQYTLNLEQYIQESWDPAAELRELYLPQLWALAHADPPRPKFRKYAFSRVAAAIKLIAIVAAVLAILLSGPFNRRGQAWRIVIAVATLFAVEGVVAVLVNATLASSVAGFGMLALCAALIAGGIWFLSRRSLGLNLPFRRRPPRRAPA